MTNDNKEIVICIYNDKEVSAEEKILELFRKYIKSNLQNIEN